MKPPYRFALGNNDGYLSVVNGSVITGPDKVPMQLSNWDSIEMTWERHERYHGILRKQTNAAKFVKDAAFILRWAYFTQGGIMAKCYFYVDELNTTTQEYEQLFYCDIDFATFKSKRDEVEVSCMEAGLISLINAYENTEYEIPIDGDAINVLMDGIYLKTRYRYLSTGFTGTLANTQQNDLVGIIFVRQEGDLTAGHGNTVTASIGVDTPFFTAVYNTDVVIDFDLNISFTVNSGANNAPKLRIQQWPGTAGVGTPIIIPPSGSVAGYDFYTPAKITSGSTASFNAKVSVPVSLAVGNTLELWIDSQETVSASTMTYTVSANSVTYVNCKTLSGNAEKPAFRWYTGLLKIIDKLGGGIYGLVSNYLNNSGLNPDDYADAIPFQTALVSEQTLKGIKEDPALKLKLEEMRADALAGMAAGFGVEGNNIRVEHLSYFYQKDVVICELTSVNNVEIGVMAQAVINTARFGYDGGDAIDDINKLNEFNTTQVRKWPVISVLNKADSTWDMVRPYSAAMNYIELVRAQYDGSTVTINNTKRDASNKNFIIYINKNITPGQGYYELDRSTISLSGVDFPEKAYNVRISPNRNTRRLACLIKSYMLGLRTGFPHKTLMFQTTDQNARLQSKVSNAVGDLLDCDNMDFELIPGDPLFAPQIITLDTALPRNFPALMAINPYGVIRIPYKSQKLDGFIKKVTLNTGKPKAYNTELIASPNNTLLTYR